MSRLSEGPASTLSGEVSWCCVQPPANILCITSAPFYNVGFLPYGSLVRAFFLPGCLIFWRGKPDRWTSSLHKNIHANNKSLDGAPSALASAPNWITTSRKIFSMTLRSWRAVVVVLIILSRVMNPLWCRVSRSTLNNKHSRSEGKFGKTCFKWLFARRRKYMETWTQVMHLKWEVTWMHGTQPNTFYMGQAGE